MPPVLGGATMAVLPASPQQGAASQNGSAAAAAAALAAHAAQTQLLLQQAQQQQSAAGQNSGGGSASMSTPLQQQQQQALAQQQQQSSGPSLYQPYNLAHSSPSNGLLALGHHHHHAAALAAAASQSAAHLHHLHGFHHLAAAAAAQQQAQAQHQQQQQQQTSSQQHPSRYAVQLGHPPPPQGSYGSESIGSVSPIPLERRDAEIRDIQQQQQQETREREKLEREKLEKQRAVDQAVQRHFEESLRQAQQKRNMPNMSSIPGWSSFMPLPPPPHAAGRPPPPHHLQHPSAGTPPQPQQPQAQHPSQQQQQQQQQQREQREREREREQRDREREHRDREEREHHLVVAAAAAAHQQAAVERSQREQQEASEYAAQQSLAYLRAAAGPQAAQISRPSSVPGKVDYPPPAHSRSSKSSSSLSVSSRHDGKAQPGSQLHQSHQVLPKAEPSLFGYPGYQPAGSFAHDAAGKPNKPSSSSNSSSSSSASSASISASSSSSSSSAASAAANQSVDKSGGVDIIDVMSMGRSRGHPRQPSEVLPNPPPLLSDHKSSVIVKNEGSSREQQQQQQHPKQPVAPIPAHSPSPKMMSYLNVSPVPGSQHKSPYECRSPTQSPHGHHQQPPPHHLHNDLAQQSKLAASQHHGRPGSAHHLPAPGLQHPSVNRHSPHAQPQQQQQPQSQSVSQVPHPSPPESRYLSRPEPQLAYPSPHQAKSPYSAYQQQQQQQQQQHPHQHPHQPPSASPTSHYAAPAASKPKVSSPAPSHIYGKPNSGIMTGTPVCRAPDTGSTNAIGSSSASSASVTSVPLPLTSKAGSSSSMSSSSFQPIGHHPGSHYPHLAPPPAHISRSPYDSRGYGVAKPLPPPPTLHSASSISKLTSPMHLLPPTGALAPIARPPPGLSHPVALHQQGQLPLGVGNNNFQTQPLDLGVERSGSPKRKASTPQGSSEPVSLEVKKRRIEETQPQPPQPHPLHHNQQQQQQPSSATNSTTNNNNMTTTTPTTMTMPAVRNAISPPALSRASEPSPLIASAATSITTVVNTALLAQPNSNSQGQVNVPSVSPAPRTASGDGSVRPSSAGSVGSIPGANTNPVALTPSASASPAPSTPSAPGTPAKPDSPAPARPPSTTSTSYPVHKLKKAWLQRHSGEDGAEDTTGVVGSGSCVTLPLNIAGNKQTNGNTAGKDGNCGSGANSTTSTASVSTTNTTTSTTSLPSAVNSIHNVGSMAVNSINKSKVAIKQRKTPVKEAMNGHAAATPTPNSESLHEDSSNSEPERKAPPKRKPPKVKRKKGAAWKQQTAVQEQRRRQKKKQGRGGAAAGSESSNESEAGSVSDSSEQRFPARAIMPITTGNGNKKVPKKRGRKPRTTKDIKNKEEEEEEEEDYQPRQKKKRIDSVKSSGGSSKSKKRKNDRISTIEDKPDEDELLKSGQSWVQDELCNVYACSRLSKCRECRLTQNQRDKIEKKSSQSSVVFCRFYAFRRMVYTKSGGLACAGFNDPLKDANEGDRQLWLPGADNRLIKRDKYTEETQDGKKDWDKGDFDIELAYQIIRQVGDQFCDLIHQEKRVVEEYMETWKSRANPGAEDQAVVWKRVVKGVREMCDLCETTLFNYHWTCNKCGFSVCIDCYEARKNKNMVWNETGKGRDKYAWLLCGNRQTHVPEQLLLTQIIPADCLIQIDQRLHECRSEWGIPKLCSCDATPTPVNEHLRSLVKGDLVSVVNGNAQQDIKQEGKERKRDSGSDNSSEGGGRANGEDKNSPLNWLADVALQNQDKSDSDSDSDQEDNRSTLRELLTSHKPNGSNSNPASTENSTPNATDGATANNNTGTTNSTTNSQNSVKSGKKSTMDTLNEVISSVIEHSVKKDEGGNGVKPLELKHFVRRYKCPQRGREPLPIRIMTLTESKLLYPDVPHAWLCDGKLLRLLDPTNPKNYRIFQDQWKRGQPVIVSDVHKSLNKDLWHPDSFSKDFGDQKNDLINCMTGNIVPKQPMWKFWDGFEHSSKRLKDEQGNAMLLKLKDWPSGGDFADILPGRFADLMKCVPLSEYTHRYGRLNLTSRLPDTFTRPDLGPKMYNAYGSALYPDKGTTNLHLDVSDAVNVMVYAGISKDSDKEEQVKEALKAIDEAGCDILTRRRVREKGETPGALWHIYAARDADKIRDMLNAVALERGARLEPHHDPIHDQSFYLDGPLRERLYREYGVEGYAIVQCLGDAVFVPAGAPHQVRNLHNCIKVAEDFVSPENISHCFHLTQEFRTLSDTHTNHEDKLQIKNIIYHAVKDSLTALDTVKEETLARRKNDKTSGNANEPKPKIKTEKSDGT